MTDARDSQLFQSLILQLHHAAWAAMGKIPNPLTGKIETDLDSARLAIDTIGSLESRTAGNLEAGEKQLLDRVLRELRLNFLDEQSKQKPDASPPEAVPPVEEKPTA
jgi:hypothetical protein